MRQEANVALAQVFYDAWTTIPNPANDPPVFQIENNPAFEQPSSGEWARFAVRSEGSTQETLGSPGRRKFKRMGVAYVQIFTPAGNGVDRAKELADHVADRFEAKRLSRGDTYLAADSEIRNFWLEESSVNEIGVEGQWFQILVSTPFSFTETK